MFDTDSNGREVASVSFVVQSSTSVPEPANPPTNPPQTPTTPTQGEGNKNIDLTGIWSCDDGGTYYIRQIGNAVWWDGEDTAADPRWANVAYGTISGNTVTLEYADVPEGTATGYGTLVLDIISNDELRAKEKPESYGGSHWVRSGVQPQPPINQPVNPPVNQPVVASPWNDPSIRQLIDEWLLQQDKCVKKVYPGAYIDKWGRICGDTGTTIISCVLTQTIWLIGIVTITYGSTIRVPSITRTGCRPMSDIDRVEVVSTLWLGAKEKMTPARHRF